MKYIPEELGIPGYKTKPLKVLELTRRNLEVLLAKLDDPLSVRTLVDGDREIAVRAVENAEHYADRAPGDMFMPSGGPLKVVDKPVKGAINEDGKRKVTPK